MKLSKRSLLIATLLTAMLALFSAISAQAEGYYYRFYSPPTYTIVCDGGSPMHIGGTGTIGLEYNLPAGATIVEDIFVNGASFEHLTFPQSGSGNFTPGGFVLQVSGFPATYAERFQTVINGQVVYTSMFQATCEGAGTGTIALTNEAEGASAGSCPPIPDGAVVGDMPNGAQAYYAPGRATNITLNPGTYWVLGENKSGHYYEILLACQYLWVPVDTMQPSYQAPWSGQPLPTNVVG